MQGTEGRDGGEVAHAPDAPARASALTPDGGARRTAAGRDRAPERRLVLGTLVAVAVVAAPILVGVGFVRGATGLASAAIGVGFVLVLFGASAASLAWAAPRGGQVALAVLSGGAFARLILYAAALVALAQVGWVDRPALAIATALAFAGTLVIEMRLISRTPELFHVETGSPSAARGAASADSASEGADKEQARCE